MDELEPTTAEEREKWRLLLAATPERDFQHEALPDLERQAPLSVREAKRLIADVERASAPRQGEPKPVAWGMESNGKLWPHLLYLDYEYAASKNLSHTANGEPLTLVPLYRAPPAAGGQP